MEIRFNGVKAVGKYLGTFNSETGRTDVQTTGSVLRIELPAEYADQDFDVIVVSRSGAANG